MERSLCSLALYLDDGDGCIHIQLRDGASLFFHGSTEAVRTFADQLRQLADERDDYDADQLVMALEATTQGE